MLMVSRSAANPSASKASRALWASLAANTVSRFNEMFHVELLPGKAALLTINQFLWPDKQAFYAFAKDAFTKIHDAEVTTLIIDIRENTGGDDDMWKTGLLAYLADKPYRNASSYVKKVIAGRRGGTEQVGDVVHGFGDAWVEPDLTNPVHFSSKTYVLVGRLTYSSAVLFSNVVQDFGFAQLVGAGGYARTRQTGGVQNILLPNTGLAISIPRFVVGEREPSLVHPDIVLPDGPFDRRATVNALLDHVRSARGWIRGKSTLGLEAGYAYIAAKRSPTSSPLTDLWLHRRKRHLPAIVFHGFTLYDTTRPSVT
jgi:hypothetical protein